MATRQLSTNAEEIFPRNRYRKSFVVQNEDTSDAIYMKREREPNTSVSATNHDHRIGPGGSLSVNSLLDGTEQIQDRWTIVADANTPRVSFFETEDIVR